MGKRTDRMYMPQDRYIAALERQRARIADGLELVCFDDDTPGQKSTHCSWGLCSQDKEAWPEPDDHLFPDDYKRDGRVAPRYMTQGQQCPFDTDRDPRGYVRTPGEPHGCFYRCRFFQSRTLGPRPTRERALQLYDEKIHGPRKEDP